MDLISGHSRPAFELASELIQRGHQVKLLSTPLSKRFESRHQNLIDNEPYLRVPETTRLELRSAQLAGAPWAANRTVKHLLDWADVIHGFSFWASLLLQRGLSASKPFVLTMNTHPSAVRKDFLDYQHFNLMEMLNPSSLISLSIPNRISASSLGRFQSVFSWSSFLENEMLAWGVPGDLINKVPFALNVGRFPERLPETSNSPRILYFGSLSPVRGVESALLAFKIAKEIMPELTLLVADRGNHKSTGFRFHNRQKQLLTRRVEDLGLADSVTILGYQARMLETLLNAEVVVLPFKGVSGYSQPPLTLLEPLAMGLPVVSTNVGSIPEYVPPEPLAFIVEPRDTSGLAEAILQALRLDSQELRSQRRAYIAEHFNWGKAAEWIEAGYLKVTSQD